MVLLLVCFLSSLSLFGNIPKELILSFGNSEIQDRHWICWYLRPGKFIVWIFIWILWMEVFHLVSNYLLNGHTDRQENVDQIPDLVEQNLCFSRWGRNEVDTWVFGVLVKRGGECMLRLRRWQSWRQRQRKTHVQRGRERNGGRGEPGTGTVGAKALKRAHIYIQELTISSLHVVSFAQVVLFVNFSICNGLKVFYSSKYRIRG